MDLKHISRGITDGRDQAPARAMFKAIGFTDSDLAKPIIGVANIRAARNRVAGGEAPFVRGWGR